MHLFNQLGTQSRLMTSFKSIPEYSNVTSKQFFDEIAPAQRPIVLKGFAEKWPVVSKAKHSSQQFIDYMLTFYSGKKAKIVVAPPGENKRFFYNSDMTGVNYLSGEERVDLFFDRLSEIANREVYPAISMQNSSVDDIFPGLSLENTSTFFEDTAPRIWIGNEGIVSAHYDGSDNVACVVSGHRRFVLFPPEQTANLYPGPLNFTPAGAPTSLVDLNAPDFTRFPNYKYALQNAYSVTLGPGDAIFIPLLWWHHIESLSKVNALMNYWWNGSHSPEYKSPSVIDSLNLAILAMHDLNQQQRNAWLQMFDHYLFQQGVSVQTYIPKQQQHLLGALTDKQVSDERRKLIKKFSKNQKKQ